MNKIIVVVGIVVIVTAVLYFALPLTHKTQLLAPPNTPLTELIKARDSIESVQFESTQHDTPYGDIVTKHWIKGKLRKIQSNDSWVISTPEATYAYNPLSCRKLAAEEHKDVLRTRQVIVGDGFECVVDNQPAICVTVDYTINGPVHAVYWKETGLLLTVEAEGVFTEYYGFNFSVLADGEFNPPPYCH